MPNGVPLQEAYFEVILARTPLPSFLPQRLFEYVQGEFPRVERLPILLVEESQLPPGANPTPAGIRFYSIDGDACVQYGPRMFSFNILRYESIDRFVERLGQMVPVFAKLTEDREIERVGLSYLNNISPVDELIKPRQILTQDDFERQTAKALQCDVEVGDLGTCTVIFNAMQPVPNSALLQVTVSSRTLALHDTDATTEWVRASNLLVKRILRDFLTEQGLAVYRKVFDVAVH